MESFDMTMESMNIADHKSIRMNALRKEFAYLLLEGKTACLSGAAKLARRQHGEIKCCPRERGRKLEHHAARYQRDASTVVIFDHFFLFSYTIFASTERGASAGGKFRLSAPLRQVVFRHFVPFQCLEVAHTLLDPNIACS